PPRETKQWRRKCWAALPMYRTRHYITMPDVLWQLCQRNPVLRRALPALVASLLLTEEICGFVSTFSRHYIRTALIKKELSGRPSPSRFDRLAEFKLTKFIRVHRIVHLKGRSKHEFPRVKKMNIEPVGREEVHIGLNVLNVFLTGPMRAIACA